MPWTRMSWVVRDEYKLPNELASFDKMSRSTALSDTADDATSCNHCFAGISIMIASKVISVGSSLQLL